MAKGALEKQQRGHPLGRASIEKIASGLNFFLFLEIESSQGEDFFFKCIIEPVISFL